MIARYALYAALSVALALGGWSMWLMRANASLTVKNASLERSVAAFQAQAEQSALAREVEKARAARFAQESADMAAKIETLLTGGIPDAALDPAIIDLLNGLRD